MMADGTIILDSGGIFFLQAEKKQNLYQINNPRRVFIREKRLYNRTGNEILLSRDALVDLMDDLRGKSGLKLKELNVVLPHAISWYQYLEVDELPKDINEAYEFVMWKIQKILPIPKEQVEIRIQAVSKSKEGVKLIVAVTFKSFLTVLERSLEDMGFVIPVIMPPTIAFLNVFDQFMPAKGILVWMREKDYSMVCLIDGLPVFIREVDNPINLERIEPELFSFYSTINESFGSFIPEKVVFFDEMERSGLAEYFPENAAQLDCKGVLAGQETVKENLSLYVSGLGVS